MSGFVVRPTNSDKDTFRIKLTAAAMLGIRVKNGDLVEIRSNLEPVNDQQHLAIAWEASGGNMKDTIVQTSKVLQDLYHFKLGDRITITRSSQSLENAESVNLKLMNESANHLTEQAARFWEYYAKIYLSSTCECLATSQQVKFTIEHEQQDFLVDSIDSRSGIARITSKTTFKIAQTGHTTSSMKVKITSERIGGLENQIQQIQKLIDRLLLPKIPKEYRPVQGILIYGTKGTGKTCLIETITKNGWSAVIKWKPGLKIDQQQKRPSIVVVRSRYLVNTSHTIKDELEELFESIIDLPVLVVAETRHPNEIDQTYRSEGKFAAEIELPIPTSIQRRQILMALNGSHQILDTNFIEEVARKTHGYVGADLYALLRRILEISSERSTKEDESHSINGVNSLKITDLQTLHPDQNDLQEALQQIRPSALQEIFLETPNVLWSDIGGQHEIKRQLQNAVERPLTHSDRMKNLGLKPKKGILLYGPPGCSKTLLVRALATEAKVNFLAVKGAELISMYVGESEKATREIFRKARAASPSIIFFDEIDAIASRNRGGQSSNELNVLTTLLNEMDGFEELRNVFVVAATNKPQSIDPALLRPGRFDNVVYIGPPDEDARSEIFKARFDRYNYRHDEDDGSNPLSSTQRDATKFAKLTTGFSGAEIVSICHTAGEYALDDDRDFFTVQDIVKAIDKTPKSITLDMIRELEEWNASRMR